MVNSLSVTLLVAMMLVAVSAANAQISVGIRIVLLFTRGNHRRHRC
jgi:hypothetical protein